MSNINDLWRKLLLGNNQLILVKILKGGILALFDLLLEMNILNDLPRVNLYFKQLKSAQDLSEIRLHAKYEIGEFGKVPLIGIVGRIRREGEDFNLLRNQGHPHIVKLERLEEFLRVADIIIKARHFSAHNHNPRNDSGWALKLVGAVFSIIELSPHPIDEEDTNKLKSLGLRLISAIQEIEKYDEDKEDNEGDREDLKKEEVWDERHDQVMGLLLDIEGTTSYLQQVLDDAHHINEEVLEISNSEFDEAKKILDQSELEQLNKDELDPETELANILSSELGLELGQADRELLMLQREIKNTFKCENWENIAQGPFRENILQNKIVTKDDWLANDFIKYRYTQHAEVMDRQLDSEIGESYFAILRRVTWPD